MVAREQNKNPIKENMMPESTPNRDPQGFDLYRYRTALMVGGAATAIVGDLCFGGHVENVGDVLVYLGGIASGLGLCQFLQNRETQDRREP